MALVNQVISRSGDRNTILTTQARRHGENCRKGGLSGHPITRSFVKLLCDVTLVVTAALREIFDESAYDRFLARTQAVRSVESYREFIREREAGMARKPRCC